MQLGLSQTRKILAGTGHVLMRKRFSLTALHCGMPSPPACVTDRYKETAVKVQSLAIERPEIQPFGLQTMYFHF